MEKKNNILNQYRSRIVFPVVNAAWRGAMRRAVHVEDYIIPVKRRKKERTSERVREILYKRQ